MSGELEMMERIDVSAGHRSNTFHVFREVNESQALELMLNVFTSCTHNPGKLPSMSDQRQVFPWCAIMHDIQ